MRSLVSWVFPQRHSQEPKCLACVGFHVVLGVEAPDVFESGESAVVPDRVLTKSGHHRVDAFHVALCVKLDKFTKPLQQYIIPKLNQIANIKHYRQY